MKPRGGIPYYDEELTQYIIDAVSSTSEPVIKLFSPEDHSILKNISSATLEQKLYLLGKLGKRFAIVIADRAKVSNRPLNVKSISTWFRKRILQLAGPTLKSWGMFVRADKELMQNLSRLSLDINPKTMYLLRHHEEIALHAENVRKLEVKIAVEHQSQLLIDSLLAECYGFMQRFGQYDERRYNLKREQIPILFYMSANRHRFISVPELNIYLGEARKIKNFQYYINDLVKQGFVQEDLQEGLIHEGKVNRVFQLTGHGILAVNSLRDRITTHS